MESRQNAAQISPSFIYVTFFVTGVVTTLLGPLLPQLAARWTVDDLHSGYLFTLQFAGSLAGTLFTGLILPKLGFKKSLAAGYLFMAAGVVALAFANWHGALASVFCIGIGLGLTIPGTNLLFAEMYPGSRASKLSTLNFAWGIGAIAVPIFVSIAGTVRSRALLIVIGAVCAAICAAYISLRSSEPDAHAVHGTKSAEIKITSRMDLLFWILGLMFFFYVGTESATAGWIASYAQRLDGTAHLSGILAPSFFWAGLLLGRAIAPAIFRRVRETIVARLSLVLACAGVSIAYLSAGVSVVMAGAFILGLGLGPIYPIVVSEISGRFGPVARRIAPILFAMSSLGGTCLPWMVGYVSTRAGQLRTGLLVIFAGTVVLILLSFVSFRAIATTGGTGTSPDAPTPSS